MSHIFSAPARHVMELRPSDAQNTLVPRAWKPCSDAASSSSSRMTGISSRVSGALSAREPRDPRACPLAGASRDYESVHRQFHDNAAGARHSWWLRQRDISTNYARSNGALVGGPAVFGVPNENVNARSRHIAKQLREAFAGAAGHRTSVVGDLAPKPSQVNDADGLERGRVLGSGTSERRRKPQQVAPQSMRKSRELAAGKQYMGSMPRQQGLKVYPAAADLCETAGLLPGREGGSPQREANHFGKGLSPV